MLGIRSIMLASEKSLTRRRLTSPLCSFLRLRADASSSVESATSKTPDDGLLRPRRVMRLESADAMAWEAGGGKNSEKW